MADIKDTSPEAVKAFFDAILRQSEMLGSWSLAVFGACIALVAWYVQRRLDSKDDAHVRALSLVFTSAVLQGVSILIMYLAYGQLVNVIPSVQFAKIQSAKEFFEVIAKTDFDSARWLFILQFGTFFIGILLLGIFAGLNYHLVRLRPRRRT